MHAEETVAEKTPEQEAADRRTEFIASMRAAADFLEAHPTVLAPRYLTLDVFVDTREQLAEQARATTWEKVYNGDWFYLSKPFGPVKLEINAKRETVCRKVVTGRTLVPAQPEHETETFEWVCEEPSLLGGAQ